jgi:hypothetical protein
MRRAADAFVADVVLDGDGTIATLLTSHTAFVDDALAPLYGLAARAGFDKASVDPRRHTGILNEPALLAAAATPNEGSPIRRGRLVREALFCQPVPSAPPTVNTKLPDPVPGQSQRQRYSAHVNDGSCKACHGQMDPIGFGFLKFDGIGAFHDTDAGGPIDSSSELTGTDADGAFSGADELAERMAKSAQVRRCVARQWLRFAFRRNEASDGEDAALSAIAGGFAASAGNVRDLLVDVAQSETFTLRRRIEATQGVKP